MNPLDKEIKRYIIKLLIVLIILIPLMLVSSVFFIRQIIKNITILRLSLIPLDVLLFLILIVMTYRYFSTSYLLKLEDKKRIKKLKRFFLLVFFYILLTVMNGILLKAISSVASSISASLIGLVMAFLVIYRLKKGEPD